MFKNLIFIAIVVMGLASCNQNGKFNGFKKGKNSVWYQVHTKSGDTVKPKFKDYVTVDMRYYLKDTVLFDSKSIGEDFVFPMNKPMFQGDIYEGMKLMSPGDSFTFAVVADSFYYKTANLKQLPKYLQAGEPMYFDIKMKKIQSPEQYQKEKNAKLQQKRNEQLDKLRVYLNENKITVKPLNSGLIYETLKKGKGSKPKIGDMCEVLLHVEAIGEDYTLFDNFNDDPLFIEYGKPFDTKGLMEGIGLMKEGELARLIVPTEIGVGKDGKNGTVPPFSTIVYKVKLNKLRTKEEVKEIRKKLAEKKEREKEALKKAEPAKIAKYIKKHKITTKPTKSGLYFISIKEGSGLSPKKGDTLSVHYTLYNTDDKKLFSTYDTGEPFNFILQTGVVVPGWEEALQMMKEGGKAKLIIPSDLGYKGVEKKAYKIPPYSPLIEEVELISVNKFKK